MGFAFFAILLLEPAHLNAQKIPIKYDTTIQGTINPVGNIDSFYFDAGPNDLITLLLDNLADTRNNSFYPRMEIYNPSGTLMKTLIAGGTTRFDTTLDAGTYTIWVMDDNYFEGGDYNLSFVADSFPQNSICVPPDTSITAWWPLEDTGTIVSDIIGGNIGTSVNGPVRIVGRVGNALKFDGVNDYVAVPDNNQWAFGRRDFSIEFWANFDGPGGGSLANPTDVFISHDEGPGTTRKWYFAHGGGFLYFHINGPGIGPKYIAQVPFTPLIGKWYHLAVTRQANTFSIYVNGVLRGSSTNSDSVPNPNAPLLIGQSNESLAPSYVNGLLDEMTIYNRALTSSEILDIAKAANAGKCKNLTITTSTLPAVLLNDSLSITLNAGSGKPPYSWSITNGVLPNSVTFSSNGVLSGIPTEAKDFIFTVRVTDSIGNFAEKEFFLKVLVSLPPPDITIHKTGTVAVPGREMDYFIKVENNSDVDINNQAITEILDLTVMS